MKNLTLSPQPQPTSEHTTQRIAQARAAWAEKPDDLALSTALAQALLNGNQAADAYETAKRTYALHPHALTAMEKLALSAIATQRWPVAHSVLLQVEKALTALAKPLPALVTQLLAELAPRWWLGLSKGGISLRRPEVADTPFIAATFGNQRFMQQYHRFQKSDDAAVSHFIAAAQRSPRETRRLDWIISDRAGRSVGLAAMVDIDWPNQRGELLIGATGAQSPLLAALATAAVIEFAFERLNLAKLISYVYGDNPAAQANTLHLGFVQEGLLRSHITCAGGRMDLFINGMTQEGFINNPLLRKLNRRWPGAVQAPRPTQHLS